MVAQTIGAKVVATVDYILQDFAKVAVADYELQVYVMEDWNTVEEHEAGPYLDVEMAEELMKASDAQGSLLLVLVVAGLLKQQECPWSIPHQTSQMETGQKVEQHSAGQQVMGVEAS